LLLRFKERQSDESCFLHAKKCVSGGKFFVFVDWLFPAPSPGQSAWYLRLVPDGKCPK
jgi:hypothetical protein